MATNLVDSYLRRHLANYIKSIDLDGVVSCMTDGLVIKTLYTESQHEIEQLKSCVQHRDKDIIALQDQIKNLKDTKKKYWNMVGELDEELDKLKLIDRSDLETRSQGSNATIPVQNSEDLSNVEENARRLEEELDDCQKNLLDTKTELTTASAALVKIKRDLGLRENATTEQVSIQIDDLVKTNEGRARLLSEKWSDEKRKVKKLEEKVKSLNREKDLLNTDLEMQKERYQCLRRQAMVFPRLRPPTLTRERSTTLQSVPISKCVGCEEVVKQPHTYCICAVCMSKLHNLLRKSKLPVDTCT